MGAAGTGEMGGGTAGTGLVGKYSGPVCPHAASRLVKEAEAARVAHRRRWEGGFTITIRV